MSFSLCIHIYFTFVVKDIKAQTTASKKNPSGSPSNATVEEQKDLYKADTTPVKIEQNSW